jgi:hypothetical protein
MSRIFTILRNNILYILCLIVILIFIAFFLSWNWTKVADYSNIPVKNSQDIRYNVDVCSNTDNKSSLNGWIYSSIYPKHGNHPEHGKLEITMPYQGKEYLIPLETYQRPDVSSAFGLPNQFERYGFSASIRRLNLPDNGGIFNINIIDGGVIYRSTYVCKK